MRLNTQSELLRKDRLKMKNSICGILMFISVAICGGGIDSGNKVQTVIGFVMFILFAMGVIVDGVKEDIEHKRFTNNASYPSFLRK